MLESNLRDLAPGVEFAIREGDLYSITRAERDALLDEMVTGADFPFVFVDGKVVHSGNLDARSVVDALDAG